MFTYALHSLLAGLMKNKHDYFVARTPFLQEIQTSILLNTLKANSATRFGREHGFGKIATLAAYRKQVPVRTWEDFSPFLDMAAAGPQGELVAEPVLLYEPTSGSSAASKYVPYTARLRREFNAGIHTWLYDLYAHLKGIRQGSHYWSISPVAGPLKQTEGKVKVGFNEDSEYLGPLGLLLRRLFVMPSQVKQMKIMEDFLYASAYFLMRSRDLALVSVWSPDYLLRLLDRCVRSAETITRDIHDGTLAVNPAARQLLKPFVKADRERARRLDKSLEEYQGHTDESRLFAAWWPGLALVSAWEDGASAPGFAALKKKLAHAHFQGKGLLATEGLISLPLYGLPAPVCAYTSHFLELLPVEGGAEDARYLHEVEDGQLYSVVMTTGGGLYRYALGDVVRVVGHWRGLPLFRFVARNSVSDLVGEKLAEPFVRKVLDAACHELAIRPVFMLLAPVRGPDTQRYVLFIEDSSQPSAVIQRLAGLVEARLRGNFHYDYALRLGQLAPVKAYRISSHAAEAYTGRLAAEGLHTGSIKRAFLDKRLSWDIYFKGEYVTDETHPD